MQSIFGVGKDRTRFKHVRFVKNGSPGGIMIGKHACLKKIRKQHLKIIYNIKDAVCPGLSIDFYWQF